jgi:hypothetical protein
VKEDREHFENRMNQLWRGPVCVEKIDCYVRYSSKMGPLGEGHMLHNQRKDFGRPVCLIDLSQRPHRSRGRLFLPKSSSRSFRDGLPFLYEDNVVVVEKQLIECRSCAEVMIPRQFEECRSYVRNVDDGCYDVGRQHDRERTYD